MLPRMSKEEVQDELKRRYLESLLEVATPQWLRAQHRSKPNRTLDAIEKFFPKQIIGSGEQGQHEITVTHAVRSSPLDETVLIEGTAQRLLDE